MTISQEITRDIESIIAYIREHLDTLTPREVSDYTIKLSICFGNIGQDLAAAEAAYAKSWIDTKKTCATNAEADKISRGLPEYLEKKKLEYYVKGLKEIICALKKRQALLADEVRFQH